MLQLKTIHEETFSLLNAISSHKEVQNFSLAGGTALALQLGHRISIDLDFFTQEPFDPNELFEFLRGAFTVSNCIQAKNSLSLFVKSQNKEVKVDLIRHNYPLLRPIQNLNHLQVFSLEDIAAMKLNAIANRGSKKDFYDIHALLTDLAT
jgi:predicted nucleotidyltransferase component of viral defense system